MAYFRFFARLGGTGGYAHVVDEVRIRPTGATGAPLRRGILQRGEPARYLPLLLRGFGRFQGVVFGFAMVCQRRGLDEVAWARSDFGTNLTWRG